MRAAAALLAIGLAACTPLRGTDGGPEPIGEKPRTDTAGACASACDGATPTIPILGDTSGYGDVTTYGGVTPAPSGGGACNYGPGGITHYAAIQVHRIPGDNRGQWRGGRACGQCAEVRARTPTGWKSTVVRIVDKCPDGNCGIDLGGAPAQALMGDKPGRYSGEWRYVPCDGHPGVSDGDPALHVKEGSNPWWCLVQVRNASARIVAMRVRAAGSAGAWTDLPWAAEAENFFKVPTSVLQDAGDYDLEAVVPGGKAYTLRCKGSALAAEKAALALKAP